MEIIETNINTSWYLVHQKITETLHELKMLCK